MLRRCLLVFIFFDIISTCVLPFNYHFWERNKKITPFKVIRSILESRKHMLVESGIKNLFASGIRNPTLWNPESSSRIPENMSFGIRNPLRWNHKSSTAQIRSLHHGIQNLRLSWITLHGAKKCRKRGVFVRLKVKRLLINFQSLNLFNLNQHQLLKRKL